MAITLMLAKWKVTTDPVLRGGRRNSMEVLIGKNISPGAIVEKDYVLIIAKNKSKILLVALSKQMLKSVQNAGHLTPVFRRDATPKYPENSLGKYMLLSTMLQVNSGLSRFFKRSNRPFILMKLTKLFQAQESLHFQNGLQVSCLAKIDKILTQIQL